MTGCPVPTPRGWRTYEFLSSRHGDPHLMTDGPEEAGQFACDGRDDDGGLLATGDQPAITSAESSLSLPCDIAHVLGQTDQDLSLVSGDASRILIAPCGFDEHAA